MIAGAGIHDSIVIAIAVLIITCPCAIALAIPAVQVVAAGALFRSGVILNGGSAIERLAEADTIVFDKTGTLTLPEPRVDESAGIEPENFVKRRRGSRCRAIIRSRPRLPAGARAQSLTPAQSRSRGKAYARTIDGKEARLGSAGFCGIADAAHAPGSDASFNYLHP